MALNTQAENTPLTDIDSTPERQDAGIGVLERAMSLLNIVSSARRPLGFTELQRSSGLPKATLHRMLSTLRTAGLVGFNSNAKTYQLGLRFLELAHQVWGDFDLRVSAQDELLRLRDLFGETIQLAVLDGDGVVVVASEEPRVGVRMASSTGLRLPLHSSALGKILTAFMDDKTQKQMLDELVLDRLTSSTLTTPGQLQSDLDICRARSYAMNVEENEEGVLAIAVPILNAGGQAIGAIGISGPAFRLTPEKAKSFVPALVGAARRISNNVDNARQTQTERVD